MKQPQIEAAAAVSAAAEQQQDVKWWLSEDNNSKKSIECTCQQLMHDDDDDDEGCDRMLCVYVEWTWKEKKKAENKQKFEINEYSMHFYSIFFL